MTEISTTCPKCSHAQRAPAPCHRCGFDFATHDAPASAEGASAVRAPLMDMWAEIAEHLDDVEAHEAFIRACGLAEQLQLAGQCYRDLDPREEDPRVARYRQRVLNAALARFSTMATPRDPDRDRLRVLLLLLLGALIILGFAAGLYFANQAMEQHWAW